MRATATISVLTVLALTSSLGGQTREGVMGELLRDVNTAQMKIVGLAKAMPAAAYDWRPNKGVRSTAEVLIHVAADNYFIPALMGATPPAETGDQRKEILHRRSVREADVDAGADHRRAGKVVRLPEGIDEQHA